MGWFSNLLGEITGTNRQEVAKLNYETTQRETREEVQRRVDQQARQRAIERNTRGVGAVASPLVRALSPAMPGEPPRALSKSAFPTSPVPPPNTALPTPTTTTIRPLSGSPIPTMMPKTNLLGR